jgi:hypothetical protein
MAKIPKSDQSRKPNRNYKSEKLILTILRNVNEVRTFSIVKHYISL